MGSTFRLIMPLEKLAQISFAAHPYHDILLQFFIIQFFLVKMFYKQCLNVIQDELVINQSLTSSLISKCGRIDVCSSDRTSCRTEVNLKCTAMIHFKYLSTSVCAGYFGDDILCHFCASMISGLVTTAASMPVDIVKTRYSFTS